jgi:DNA-binding transcriptional ArsR family regulator
VIAPFQAIADPSRRRILQMLARAPELSSGDIAAHFTQTAAAISQHLGVLQKARLVSIRRDGVRRLYRLREEGLDELRGFLEQFWTERLGRLKSQVEVEAHTRRRSAPRGRRRLRHGRRRRRA